MNILLLGAPGSGKGSQAEKFESVYSFTQISTGDLLRNEVAEMSETGIEAKVFMDKGELVPDNLVSSLLAERIKGQDCSKGIIFDGYPRTVEQTGTLDDILKKKGCKLDMVINIKVPFDVIVKRLSSRRLCGSCGKGYNLISNPPKSDKCECGGDIITRYDDREDVVRKRLGVYQENTEPLIGHYKKKDMLVEVDGDRKVDEIFKDLQKILNERIGM